jgi:predicted permease
LPYADAERLVLLAERSDDGEREGVPYPNFADWRTRAQSFEGMALSGRKSFNLMGVDQPRRLSGRWVNWNFFSLLGVNPQLGRLFAEADDRYGAARTLVLSHGFWQRHYGGATNVIGKAVLLSSETYTVIGVLPPGFEYLEAADVYVPLGLFLVPNSGMTDRGSSFGGTYAIARLKPGVTLQQANSEMVSLGQQLAEEYPETNVRRSAHAEALQDVMSESVRHSLWILLGAVGFILLIACINVANLLLVRAAERQKELAVRLAIGAGRLRIVRQMLTESLLLAGMGSFAMLALLLAAVGIYGVISYTVRQRTHELGIRLALGARASDVLKMILGEGMRLTLIGIALGLGGAYALTKYLESLSTLLYGVRATDPLTFAGTAFILLIVALVACFLPARRATKVDPLKALRYE